MDNLLGREVHEDFKGFFVYFGGFRFRPKKGFKTRAVLGEQIMLNPEPYNRPITRYTFTRNHIGHVFIHGQRETWSKGLKHKQELPQWFLDNRK